MGVRVGERRKKERKKKHGIDEVQGEIKENPYLDQLE